MRLPFGIFAQDAPTPELLRLWQLRYKVRAPVTQVSKLLGHQDPSITSTVYSHWFGDAEDKNREAMGDLAAAVLSPGSKTVAAAVG